MTGPELQSFFETIVDDSPDVTYVYNLLNHAKDLIETERDWEFLKKVKTGLTWNSGDTFQTNFAFPTSWIALRSLYVTDYPNPYLQVPFEHQQMYKDLTGYWFADYNGQVFHLCGQTDQPRALSLYYTEPTPDINATDQFGWPVRFHKLVVFYAAGMHMGGSDWDSINANMAPANRAEALTLRASMVAWDARLKVASMGNRSQLRVPDISRLDNVIDMDRI